MILMTGNMRYLKRFLSLLKKLERLHVDVDLTFIGRTIFSVMVD